ncbi:MAG: uncharacterized protein JWN98_294 [Abditibacteriota bacterium]|nr:uncharacterized protein [Abditibacteriota bacterium]
MKPARHRSGHHPIRTCAGCGGKFDQSTLLRLASHRGALPALEGRVRAPGRGVSLCRKKACIERAWQRHAIERGLKLKLTTPEERQVLALLKQDIYRLLGETE